MKNLGKILLLIFLTQLSVVADIVASVDSPHVERGEMVTYEIMLNGDNIVRPTILSLCGENVISTGSQTSIQMINGTMTKSYIFTYRFLPQKSCVIEPIEVEIDSKIVKTNSVQVTVSKIKIEKNSPFILTLESDKSQVYVGEPFEVTLLFKQRDGAEAVDSEFIAPTFQGFWVKEESKSKRYKKDGYTITEKKYKLSAQRTGSHTISSAEMRIAFRTHTRDPWAGVISRIKWKSHYSNELIIGVKPIPNRLSLVGDFTITAEIDKNSIKANEAVNVNIRVQGEGNLEDIKSFKPNLLDDVNVFDEKIQIKDGVLMQKMAFVSQNDFTIPSFELKFYNPKTKKTQTVATKSFKIKVINSKPKQESLKIKREKSVKKDLPQSSADIIISTISGLFIFLMGIVVGIFLSFIRVVKKNKKRQAFNLKDEKVLFMKLLPYKDDSDVQDVLNLLESNIYSKSKNVIDKKLLKELIMRYDIS